MSKSNQSLLSRFKQIDIRNNFVQPSKDVLKKYGVSFQEYIYFKWKKHRELESIHNGEDKEYES